MSLVRDFVRAPTEGVSMADTPQGLSAIKGPGCAAAIWRRALDPDLQSWIDGLEPARLPKARVILPVDEVRSTVLEICELCETPDGPDREALVDDVTALADVFARLTSARHVRLRFDVVTTNACRRFHIDAVSLRLLCTYRGTGTQYGVAADGADPERILTVPTGAPILLRGTLWPEQPSASLRHRSPPIEGTGETRLVLVLDPVNEPEDDV